MRSTYSYLLESQIEFDILMSIALEAEEQTTQEQPAANDITKNTKTESDKINTNDANQTKYLKNQNIFNSTVEKIKKFIEIISNTVSDFVRVISNRLKLMQDTDKGFFSLYYKRKSMIKPHPNVIVTTYTYVPQVLDQGTFKLIRELLDCINTLQAAKGTTNQNARVSEILDASISDIIPVLLKPYGQNNELKTIPEYIQYLIGRYRGEKKETTYTDTQIPFLESLAKSSNQLADQCNQYITAMETAYRKIKTTQSSINSNSTEEEMRLVSSNVQKASVLSKACSTIVGAYFELKLEQSLAARAVLKRFYQF